MSLWTHQTEKGRRVVEILVGVIVALLGVFVGVFLVQNERISRELNDVKSTVDSLRAEAREQPIVPSAHLFLTALTREAAFWQKLSIQRTDKTLIATRIARKYIEHGDAVFIDSGTTVDQIPHMLRQQGTKARVFTNNLLAAISVVPQAENELIQCSILPGRIDARYGATYNIEDIEGPVRSVSANKIVLAATAMSFEDGPMVDVTDHLNLRFKRALVDRALSEPTNVLLIAVDWTKFVRGQHQPGNGGRELNPVLELQDWKTIKAMRHFILVTTNPPESLQTSEAIEARDVVETFVHNARSGMSVIFADLP
jgi:DeoR/GlpR family transcriptional regulator of sugar metabolism